MKNQKVKTDIKGNEAQMRVVEYKQYGNPEVLKVTEAEKPTPKDNEVLVRIHATTVTATECNFRRGEPFMARLFTGLLKPKLSRLGEELAGVVEAVGKDVTEFTIGDKVFGTAGPEFGANAEYLCIPTDGVLAKMPSNYNFEESASSVDGFLTALPFLRDTGEIKKGQKVLINGASGSVGSSAVQIAKYYRTEVTAVCSGSNIDLVKSLGADHVIDYTKDDFTKGGEKYDIIFDAVGKVTFSQCKKVLTDNGVFLEAGIGMSVLPHVLITSVIGDKKAKIAATGLRAPKDRVKDLRLLKDLMEQDIIKPVIDRKYDLEEISLAHAYVDKGHKKGNVVVAI